MCVLHAGRNTYLLICIYGCAHVCMYWHVLPEPDWEVRFAKSPRPCLRAIYLEYISSISSHRRQAILHWNNNNNSIVLSRWHRPCLLMWLALTTEVEVPMRAAKIEGVPDSDFVSCSSTSVMGVGHGLHMEHSLWHINDVLKPLCGSIQPRRSTIFSRTTMYIFDGTLTASATPESAEFTNKSETNNVEWWLWYDCWINNSE